MEPLDALLGLSVPQHLAVATSGGPDSLVLTLMLQDAIRHTPHTLTALTVDHGLRPESAMEAECVHRYCTKNKISHVTLKASYIVPGTMHHKARMARYETLALWCHQNGVHHLFLGHHQDDQLETFLMRLRRQSGPYGLGGMLPVTPCLGLWLWRPLLNIPKTNLLECARAYDAPFVHDPSNENPRFERSRIRRAHRTFTSKERFFWLQEQNVYAQQKRALCNESEALLAKSITWHQGTARFSLNNAPKNLWPHMIRAVVEPLGGRHGSVLCLDKLRPLFTSPHKRSTRGGCLITFEGPYISVQREWPRIQDVALEGQKHILWDHRFYLSLCQNARGHLRALGHGKPYAHLPYHLKGYPGIFHQDGSITPFWETAVFRHCRWIQETRFPQTQRRLQRGV
jgi:tRNA(Ile)-lysidine synthase